MIIVVTTIGLPALRAQETAPFSQMNLALRLSTMGVGLELATPLGAHINARAGADVLPFSLGYQNYSLDSYSDRLEPAFGYVPLYRAKGKINMVHGHLLADIHPVSRGIFHFTAGAYVGTNQIEIQGRLVDGNSQPVVLQPNYEWPTLNVDGYEVATEDGRANLDLVLGNTVKPYLGIGLGKAVTKRGFGVKFELGMLYQGDYTLKQDGHTLNLKNTNEVEGENIEMINDYAEWAEWWPVINLQFTFKLY
ncbi:MAG: hypothetical protein LBS42_10890 [Tannerella sp.]|jgi:hypothetical protein|nr:hypothetical protein [Tannerella sp.]